MGLKEKFNETIDKGKDILDNTINKVQDYIKDAKDVYEEDCQDFYFYKLADYTNLPIKGKFLDNGMIQFANDLFMNLANFDYFVDTNENVYILNKDSSVSEIITIQLKSKNQPFGVLNFTYRTATLQLID